MKDAGHDGVYGFRETSEVAQRRNVAAGLAKRRNEMYKSVRAVGTIGLLFTLVFCVGCPFIQRPNLEVALT